MSVGENSIRIKEKSKLIKETEQFSIDKKDLQDKWWLKRPEIHPETLNAKKNTDRKMKMSPTPTSDVSSSMKEFLEKEKMCKVIDKIMCYYYLSFAKNFRAVYMNTFTYYCL